MGGLLVLRQLAKLPAGGHKLRELFGKTEDVLDAGRLMIVGLQVQDAPQCGIGVQEAAIGGGAADTVDGMLHEVAIAKLRELQRLLVREMFAAQRFFRQRALQGRGQTRKVIL